MAFTYILFEKTEGVAVITLNRPEKLNALRPEMSSEMVQALEDSARDPEVRVVVLTGAGRAFCSGADMANLSRTAAGEPVERDPRQAVEVLGGWAQTVYEFAKPTIAAVNGVASGGGFSLAMACDMIIASDKASFIQVFTRRGVAPDAGSSYLLSRRAGLNKACELVFTAEPLDAREAERLGIVNKVVPQEQHMQATMELAKKIARNAPLAMIMAKRGLYRGATSDIHAALEYETWAQKVLFQTEDFREGIKAFLEKREPRFIGR